MWRRNGFSQLCKEESRVENRIREIKRLENLRKCIFRMKVKMSEYWVTKKKEMSRRESISRLYACIRVGKTNENELMNVASFVTNVCIFQRPLKIVSRHQSSQCLIVYAIHTATGSITWNETERNTRWKSARDKKVSLFGLLKFQTL